MGGSAVMGDSIADELALVVDELRSDLDPDLGHRQYAVYRVTRTWPSGVVGDDSEGAPTDAADLIEPAPRVRAWSDFGGQMVACGLDEAGMVRIDEVSLTYTEAELFPTGDQLAAGQEFFLRIDDGHGQGVRSRLFSVTNPPYPDREGTSSRIPGWVLTVNRVGELG